MGERLDRLLLTFGAPPVTFNKPSTWTPEVKDLYRRVRAGDYSAVAPLLKWDLEFIRTNPVFLALVLLKGDRSYPDRKAREELRKIAGIIRRRPGPRRTPLPHGDLLELQVDSLVAWIDENDLLRYKKEPAKLEERLRSLLRIPKKPPDLPPPGHPDVTDVVEWSDESGVLERTEFDLLEDLRPVAEGTKERELRETFCQLFLTLALPGRRPLIRTSRSWVIEALALHYDTDRKVIDNALARERKSKKRRR